MRAFLPALAVLMAPWASALADSVHPPGAVLDAGELSRASGGLVVPRHVGRAGSAVVAESVLVANPPVPALGSVVVGDAVSVPVVPPIGSRVVGDAVLVPIYPWELAQPAVLREWLSNRRGG